MRAPVNRMTSCPRRPVWAQEAGPALALLDRNNMCLWIPKTSLCPAPPRAHLLPALSWAPDFKSDPNRLAFPVGGGEREGGQDTEGEKIPVKRWFQGRKQLTQGHGLVWDAPQNPRVGEHRASGKARSRASRVRHAGVPSPPLLPASFCLVAVSCSLLHSPPGRR